MLTTLWLRPLLQRPRRALATALGVAVGVASVLATGLASRAAVASMTDDVETLAGDARLEVTRPGGVPIADMGRLAELCDALQVRPVVEGTAFAPEHDALLRLLGIDGLAPWTGGVVPLAEGAGGLEGLGRRLVERQGVVLARTAAERLGLAAGDTLALVVQSRRVRLEVLGVFEPARMAEAWEHVLVLDIALAQELLERPAHVDRLELVPRASEPVTAAWVADVAARARALLPPEDRVGPASERREEGERLVRSLTFNLTALAGVSVLVAIVLVATTLATSVVERRPLIALLRSLGASRAQLAGAVVLEAGALGLLGGALGVLLGALGARAIASAVHGSFATLDEDLLAGAVRLEPLQAVLGVLLGLASALAAAFLPLREAWKTPPLQHLRALGAERPLQLAPRAGSALALIALALLAARLPPWDERPIGALVSALLLLSVLIVLAAPVIDLVTRLPTAVLGLALGTPLGLARAALAATRTRAAWAASAVGVAVALAVSMTTLVSSFRANVVDWTEQTMRSDLYLRPLADGKGATVGRIAPEAVARIEALVGREHVDPYRESRARVLGREITLGGAAFAVVAREGGVPFLDGRPSTEVFREALARGGAVVNEPFARRFGLGRGARVQVSTAGGSVEREIVGVYRDFSAHEGRLVLDLQDFVALAGDEGAESVAVFLDPGSDVEAERARLRADLAGRFELEILDHREVRAEVLRVFERTFAVTTALQTLAALVAALAVVLVLTALVRERERELAIVRVLGASRAQLSGMVAGQALFLGLAGALGGLGVGVLVGYLLVTVVNVQSFGWSLRFTLPASAFTSAALVLPACLVAGGIPAWLSLRREPREALREPD